MASTSTETDSEMDQGAGRSVSYWVFQFVPSEDNRDVESGESGTKIPWRLTSYKEIVKPGDIVFFWRASRAQSALTGWGLITGESSTVTEESFARIEVTTRARFDPPIMRSELDGQSIFGTIGVVWGRQRTNFRLWVRESLLKHYPDLLNDAASITDAQRLSSQPSGRAQADDYLEKIFNIPFRIPRLNGDTAGALMEGLLRPISERTPDDRSAAYCRRRPRFNQTVAALCPRGRIASGLRSRFISRT